MSSSKYSHYVESSVKWLGEIPNHWNIKKFQDLANTDKWSIVDGPFGSDLKNEEYTDSGVPLIQLNNIIPGQHIFNGMKFVSEEKANDLIRHNAYPGDIVLAKMADPVARAAVVKSDYPRYVIVADCIRLSVNKLIADSRFAVYAINAHYFKCNAIAMSSGITRVRINMGELKRLKIALPPLIEQSIIANFLDSETTKIDALAKAFEGLIATLKEKRQAVISHAVTKGLDPSVPMKDSGIEWLGQVPAHWSVQSIKWLSPVLRGASPRPIDNPIYFDDEGEYAWVRIADSTASSGVLLETTQRLSELGSSLSVKLEPNTLFVSIAGTVGKPCITGIKACIHDGFVHFPRLKIDQKFLFRIFEAGTCYGGLGKMGTQLNLNTDTIGSIRIGVPPESEIDGILKFIDAEMSKIDALINEAKIAFDLLQERRTALISAAVTGKIDVRGLVNVDTEEKIKEAA